MAKIMVIDDDKNIREIVQRFLEQKGHKVVQVSDGAFGMEAIRKDRPDLIVLDVLMPKLDGCALGYHLKFQSDYANIPILMLTSLADRPYLAKDIAADYFMPKPFSGKKLVNKVDEILASGRVKLGRGKIERTTAPSPRKLLYRAYALGALPILAVLSFLLFQFTGGLVEKVAEDTSARAREISVMADQLFIYFVPVFFLIMVYGLFLFNKAMNTSGKELK